MLFSPSRCHWDVLCNPFLSFLPLPQFLAQLKIMDYSLLVGIHDVDRAEQEEMEVEDRAEDEECENDGVGGSLLCSYGTPPDSPGNLLSSPRFFGPGEFDPSVDVYAMKSHESKCEAMPALPTSGPLFRCPVGTWPTTSVIADFGLFLHPGSHSESSSATLSSGPWGPSPLGLSSPFCLSWMCDAWFCGSWGGQNLINTLIPIGSCEDQMR